jgi:hypothetical protein
MSRKLTFVTLAALSVVAAGLSACSEETEPVGQGSLGSFDYENTLVFVHSSGDTIRMLTGLFSYCDEWEPSNVPDYTFHVFAGFDPDSMATSQQWWWLKVVVGDVIVDEPVDFPNNFIWDQPKDADLFIVDIPGEFSSSTDESSGHITIHRLSCSSRGGIEFSIDAVIDSEFHDGGTVTVTGTFVAPVAGKPTWGGSLRQSAPR